jgi:hypothetical protein
MKAQPAPRRSGATDTAAARGRAGGHGLGVVWPPDRHGLRFAQDRRKVSLSSV